jgi:hypothetical protein
LLVDLDAPGTVARRKEAKKGTLLKRFTEEDWQ